MNNFFQLFRIPETKNRILVTLGLLFIERLTRTGLDVVIACTFFGAVTLLMMALLTFLKETRIATALLRIPETYLELHRHI